MFKKVLLLLGSFTLFVSSATTVVACTTQKEDNDSDRNSEYDQSEAVQNITTNAVGRLKSLVLADQFGLSDDKYWSTIVNYDRTNKFSDLFNINSVARADKQGLNLTGRGGESNVLLNEILDSIMGALGNINIAGIDLGSVINGALGDINLGDYIKDAGDLITIIPKLITEMPVQQLTGVFALVLQLLSTLVGPLINIDQPLWNVISETIPYAIKSALKNYGVQKIFDDMIATTAIENYQDFSFEDLTNRLWNSLITTIGYAMNANYVTNPETELNTNNGARIMRKFYAAISGGTITPVQGEISEQFGIVKYIFTTIKLLEIYLQFFGEDFFSYVPDIADWTSSDGNVHLFAADKTNREYFQSLLPLKVSSLTQAKSGINLSFFWKVLKTFLGNSADETNGMMFQKLLNSLLVGYDPNSRNRFYLLPWKNLFTNIIDNIPGIPLPGIIKNLINGTYIPAMEGMFTNKTMDTTLGGLINIVSGFLPDNIRPYVQELSNFINGRSPEKDVFLNKPFDFLWGNDITVMMPSLLTDVRNNLKLEKLNLSGLFYQANLLDLFKMFGLDLTKYGTRFTSNSLGGLITRLDDYIKIDDLTYAQLSENNLDMNLIQNLLDVLVKENPVKLTVEEDNVVPPRNGETADNSLLRQLLSNIKNPEVVQKIFGLVVTKNGEQERYEVVQESFIGYLIKFIYPQINSSNAPNYNFDDLTNARGFNGNFLKAVGNLLTTLLEGTDYTYLIQPLVTNKDIWKIQKVTNIYFPNSAGQLMYQQISLEFDPTGITLNDGSIVDGTHKAVYDLTFRRTSQLEQFSFTQIIKHRSR